MSNTIIDISCPIRTWAQNNPNAIALETHKRFSFKEFDGLVEGCQTFVHNQGIRPYHKIALVARPSIEVLASFWALLRLQATICPIHGGLPPKLLANVFDLIQPQYLCGDTIGLAPIQSADILLPRIRLSQTNIPASPHTATHPTFCPEIPATVVLTSGTAGTPKAAVHCVRSHWQAALAVNRHLSLKPGDKWLLSLPLHHVSGVAILFRCAWAGATVALPEQGKPLEEELDRLQPTHVSLVPTQLIRLLRTERGVHKLCRLKAILLGGAPIHPALVEKAIATGAPLVCSYGMTETAAMICATPLGNTTPAQGSGRGLFANSIRIANGGIEVHSPTLFQGYVTGDGGLLRPFDEEGWFRTGDTGFIDNAGFLHVTGREDAMFISGGENIHPEEIEMLLMQLPEVTAAAVVDIPDEEFGAIAVAFVQIDNESGFTQQAVKNMLASHLPRYKIPKYVITWPKVFSHGLKPSRMALRKYALSFLKKQPL